MLNWTERIIRMRKEVPEIGWGDYEILRVAHPAILALRYDWRNNSVVILHNLGAKGREINFEVGLAGEGGRILINLLSNDHSEAQENGKHQLVIEGYGYRWYRAGGLAYLLRRTEA